MSWRGSGFLPTAPTGPGKDADAVEIQDTTAWLIEECQGPAGFVSPDRARSAGHRPRRIPRGGCARLGPAALVSKIAVGIDTVKILILIRRKFGIRRRCLIV
jgi:hypothetical protein